MTTRIHTLVTGAAAVLLTAAALTLAVSCQKDEEDSRGLTFTLVADDAPDSGKAYVESNYLCWHNGDKLKINNVEKEIAVSTSESTVTATITGVDYNANGYVAAFPASSVGEMGSGSTGTVPISVPATQVYSTAEDPSGNAVQVVPMPMVGRCAANGSTLEFSNAAALVKVTVSGEGMQVYKIVVSTTDGVLSGSAEMSAGDEEENKVLVPTSETGNSVTLDCSGSLPGPGDFYLVVAPFENKAVTVTVWAKDASSQKYAITKTSQHEGGLTIGRNQIGPIPITIGADADKVNFWGSGNSAADPYLITDKKDLETFRTVTNAGTSGYCGNTVYYKQTADIENYGSYSNGATFSGHYDGGGHFIEFNLNTTSTTGLVTKLGNGAVIENLTLKGDSLTTSATKWGAFCCEISTSATVTLKNCTNEISCTSTGSNGLGGLIGYVDNTSIFLTLEDCTNNANISGKYYAGGLLGAAIKVGSLTMTRCSNEGAVTCASATTAKVGGLVSYVSLNNAGNKIDLDRCLNSGTVALTGKTAANMGACGGIIGYLSQKKNNTATITNCANKADLSAGGNIQCMGGIVGILQSPTSGTDTCTCNIFNSYSTGNLSSSGTVKETGGMGGIMAILESSTRYQIEINNCYFSGSLEATGGKTNYSGIASKKDNITCTNCYSTYTDKGGSANGLTLTATSIPSYTTLNNNRVSLTEWSEWKAGATPGATPVFMWEQ